MKWRFACLVACLAVLSLAAPSRAEVLDSPAVKAGTSPKEDNAAKATCRVELPADAEVRGVKAFAREIGGKWYECIGGGNGHDCGGFSGSTNPIGWASFKGNYQVEAPGDKVVVTWEFSNWSHNKEREAKIQVTYKRNK